VDFFEDLEDGGGCVFSIFRNPSSNPSPFVVMAIVFTLPAAFLAVFQRNQKRNVNNNRDRIDSSMKSGGGGHGGTPD
jgi:hypothetical protein